jgi:hypothetical protein
MAEASVNIPVLSSCVFLFCGSIFNIIMNYITMKNQFIFSCLMILLSSNVFSQVQPLGEPDPAFPIMWLSTAEPFELAIKAPYVWEPKERDAFYQILQSPRFKDETSGDFSLSNMEQLRALKDLLDIMPSSRAMNNPMYDQALTETTPCLYGNFNNPALRPDQLAVNYKASGLMYRTGTAIPYPFSVSITNACNGLSAYAMVVDAASQVGFGVTTPQSQYHFAVPSFQVGQSNTLQFKISNAINNESLVFSKATQQLFKVNNTGRIYANEFQFGDNSTLQFAISNATGQEGLVFSRTGYDLFKVNKDGKVFAREFEITIAASRFPDYVFFKNYPLHSLQEVDTYIQAHHHLPGIEPAATYEKEGTVNLGDLQLKLLEKVEELTLYAIQQQKEMDAIKAQLAAQK